MKYVIDFIDEITPDTIQLWLSQNQATIIKQFDAFTKTYLIETETELAKTELIEHLNVDSEFSTQLLSTISETIEPNLFDRTNTFDTSEDWWKTATIYDGDYDSASMSHVVRSTKTLVYLFDSGIKVDHPEFINANITNLYSVDGSYDDTRGHGTALASLIVGDTCGITSAEIKNVKIFSSTKVTMLSDLVEALDITLASILANSRVYNIINMSWAIPKNAYIEAKINSLINAGGIVVAASGNSGIPIENVTPASMSNVMTIGAYDQNFAPADFSNYSGPLSTTQNDTNSGALKAWAPGAEIKVASINGGTINASGTSLSAAIVSACIVYNSDYFYSGDELANSIDFSPYYVVQMTFGKNNILDLSDQKYSTSINRIAIFYSTPVRDLTKGLSRFIEINAYPDMPVYGQIIPEQFVKSITLQGDLPAGLTMSRGWIIGTLAEEVLETYSTTLLASYEFNTGEISAATITLVVNKSFENSPLVDQLANIDFYAIPGGGYCTFTTCINRGCYGCFQCGSKSSPSCNCQGICA